MITIPQEFARSAILRDGEAGRLWIEQLPGLVQALCRQWGLVLDGAPMHGYLGLVVPVRRGDALCALKVSWIDESARYEAIALSLWNGNGAVRLLEAQPDAGAMLLERLDSRRSLNDVAIGEAVIVAGRLIRRLAIPAPEGLPLPRLQAMAAQLAQTLPEQWERYGRPMNRRWLDAALEVAVQCGPSTGNLLVNRDLHYINVLAGEREPWLAIDPKVLVGDPEYGVAQLLWCRLDAMQAEGGLERHFEALTEAAELDGHLTRAWTLLHCVDYWFWGLSIGLTEDPARCEAIVAWILD